MFSCTERFQLAFCRVFVGKQQWKLSLLGGWRKIHWYKVWKPENRWRRKDLYRTARRKGRTNDEKSLCRTNYLFADVEDIPYGCRHCCNVQRKAFGRRRLSYPGRLEQVLDLGSGQNGKSSRRGVVVFTVKLK